MLLCHVKIIGFAHVCAWNTLEKPHLHFFFFHVCFQTYNCSQCPEKFAKYHLLRRHFRSNHFIASTTQPRLVQGRLPFHPAPSNSQAPATVTSPSPQVDQQTHTGAGSSSSSANSEHVQPVISQQGQILSSQHSDGSLPFSPPPPPQPRDRPDKKEQERRQIDQLPNSNKKSLLQKHFDSFCTHETHNRHRSDYNFFWNLEEGYWIC